MAFTLSFSASDLLLLVPEMLLTVWLCVILVVDFAMPRLPKRQLAFWSVAGLGLVLLSLIWLDWAGVSGTAFNRMFVLDRMAIFFKIVIVAATLLVLLASIDFLPRFRFFKGEY